jgi:hypothetical protein
VYALLVDKATPGAQEHLSIIGHWGSLFKVKSKGSKEREHRNRKRDPNTVWCFESLPGGQWEECAWSVGRL